MTRKTMPAIVAVLAILVSSAALGAASDDIEQMIAQLGGSGGLDDLGDVSELADLADLAGILDIGGDTSTTDDSGQQAEPLTELPSPKESLGMVRGNSPGKALAASSGRVSQLVNAARGGSPNFGSSEIVIPEKDPSFWDEIRAMFLTSLTSAFVQNPDLLFNGGGDNGGDDGSGDSGGGTSAPQEAGPFPF